MVLPGGCSCPNNTDNKSSFRINCLLISQDFHVVFLWGFLTVTTAAFGEKRTLMLRLFTAINMFCGQCLGDHCAWLFNWVLRVTPMAQCADLLSVHRFTGCFWGNATRIAGGNPLGTQEKHVVPTRRGCMSLSTSGPRTSHRQLRRSLDWTGRVCGLAFQVTGPHTIWFLPTGLHENFDLLTVRRFWRGSSTNLICLRAHVNLCCVEFGFELRPMNLPLHICSKLVRIVTFFSEFVSPFAWLPSLVRPTLVVIGSARTHVRHTFVWQ